MTKSERKKADKQTSLTDKQKRFCEEYAKDLNATQAAIRAGYAEKTAYSSGPRLLNHPAIKQELAERTKQTMQELSTKGLDISVEKTLQAIAQVAFSDIRTMFDENGDLIPPKDWDDDTAASVAALDITTTERARGEVKHVAKIKSADRLRALDMLARYHSLYSDSIHVTLTDDLAARLRRAKERMK
ncbi:terminase small subunit [Cohaesibacter gelatinilyticus]|uniref:Phage terminase small subunit n=1 Tax=Cohaesibacter gelatinilyticus TaxID=372072 RepID=A0A285PCD5_9HYPH|nr:terminase small subunit [Cohaesibacter gelatinilyticus]SNZ19405.1 phage terminase small subunit [Cohaesibacter gelatinilyticus]